MNKEIDAAAMKMWQDLGYDDLSDFSDELVHWLAERWAEKCEATTANIPTMKLIGQGYADLIREDVR